MKIEVQSFHTLQVWVKDCYAVVQQEFIKFRQYNPVEKAESRSAQELLNEAAILEAN